MPDSLVLASASPRRAELLLSAGYVFTVDPADVDERERPGEPPEAYVLRVAGDKARAVAARRREPAEIVLAADTTVVVNGEILAKPARRIRRRSNARAARRDRTSTFLPALWRFPASRELAEVVDTRVRLLPMEIDEIRWYVANGGTDGEGRRLRDSGARRAVRGLD